MDIFNFALKMELDGKAYYETLASDNAHPGFTTIFTMLASDEQKHAEVVQKLKAGASVLIEPSNALESAKNVFQKLLEKKGGFAPATATQLDAYQHALKIEADSVRLYQDIAAKTDREEVRAIVLTLVGEEKKHYNIIDNICDFVAAPQSYLAWGEFSNLKEF